MYSLWPLYPVDSDHPSICSSYQLVLLALKNVSDIRFQLLKPGFALHIGCVTAGWWHTQTCSQKPDFGRIFKVAAFLILRSKRLQVRLGVPRWLAGTCTESSEIESESKTLPNQTPHHMRYIYAYNTSCQTRKCRRYITKNM